MEAVGAVRRPAAPAAVRAPSAAGLRLRGDSRLCSSFCTSASPSCIRRCRGLGALRGAGAAVGQAAADGSMGVPVCLSPACGHARKAVLCALASCC